MEHQLVSRRNRHPRIVNKPSNAAWYAKPGNHSRIRHILRDRYAEPSGGGSTAQRGLQTIVADNDGAYQSSGNETSAQEPGEVDEFEIGKTSYHSMAIPEPTDEQPESPLQSSLSGYSANRIPSISPGLTYNPIVIQGGNPIPADAFGLTYVDRSSYHYTNLGVTINLQPPIYANATVNQTIFWDVRRRSGPNNQINVNSSASSVITQSNYREVARDLTPNVFGIPPRRNYWCRDLTIIHEQYHVEQHKAWTRDAITRASDWLKRQQASTEAEVVALFDQALDKINRYVNRKANQFGNEIKAYKAGAGDYRGRARAIKSRGRTGGYPP